MSNAFDSNNQRDNEQKKFQADSSGNTAVNVKSDDLAAAISSSTQGSFLSGVEFDSVVASYPSATVETYQYKIGGVSGTLQATITVTYTDSTKNLISSVVKS